MQPGFDAERSGRAASIAAGLLIWAGVVFSVGVLAYAAGRWWLPSVASVQGREIDGLFARTLTAVSIPFLLVQGLLGLAMLRSGSRERPPSDPQAEQAASRRARVVIAAAITATFAVDAFLVVEGASLWIRLHRQPPSDALVVEAVGEQFGWRYRYPGPDGAFGRTDPRLVSSSNPLGIDPSDPAALDDVVSQELHLVAGRPVELVIRAKDVLHSFFVPAMRFKQDAVPGRVIRRWFTPTETGRFPVACAELCGVGHYVMASSVVVETQEQFALWMQGQPPAAVQLAAAR